MTTQEKETVPGTEISLYTQAKWSRATVADGKWLQNETLEPISANDRILASAIDYVSGGVDDLTYRIDLLEDASDVINVYGTWNDFVTHSGELFDTSAITNNDIIKVLNDPNQYPDLTAEGGHQTYFRWSADNGSIWPLDPAEGQWEYIGYIEPYYNKNEVDTIIDDLSATVKSEYVPWSATDCPIGDKNIANNYSLAQGSANSASYDSFAQGKRNYAYSQSMAAGIDSSAKSTSQALGNSNTADSNGFAAGSNNSATLAASFAQGSTNYAYNSSFAQGTSNSALTQSFAQGKNNSAYYDAFAQGLSAFADNESLAQGLEVTAKSKSFAQGSNISANSNSFAQGSDTSAYICSLAQGYKNDADTVSLAQGNENTALFTAFAQGNKNSASNYAFAQGTQNTAYNYAFAQGDENNAKNNGLAQGYRTYADNFSIAQGLATSAVDKSQAFGVATCANSGGMAIGTYNKTYNGVFVIGNGTDDPHRSDLFLINKNGDTTSIGAAYFTGFSGTNISGLNQTASIDNLINSAANGGGMTAIKSISGIYTDNYVKGTTGQIELKTSADRLNIAISGGIGNKIDFYTIEDSDGSHYLYIQGNDVLGKAEFSDWTDSTASEFEGTSRSAKNANSATYAYSAQKAASAAKAYSATSAYNAEYLGAKLPSAYMQVADLGVDSNGNISSYGGSAIAGLGDYVEKSATKCTIGSANTAQGGPNPLAICDILLQGTKNFGTDGVFCQGFSNSGNNCSLAQGSRNSADNYALAQGYGNSAHYDSFAQGYVNSATEFSFAQGSANTAFFYAAAQGYANKADDRALAQGDENSGYYCSLAQGDENNANQISLAQGKLNTASKSAFAQGNRNSATDGSLAQGEQNIATGYSLAQGFENSATRNSLSQGMNNSADYNSFAQGTSNSAVWYSIAQGLENTAKTYSFAQGDNNFTFNRGIAIGGGNSADQYSIACGELNSAYNNSFAHGEDNTASTYSFAQGWTNSATNYSQAFGKNNIITNNGMVIGCWNKTYDAAFVIGNGEDDQRSDLLTIDHSGNITVTAVVGPTHNSAYYSPSGIKLAIAGRPGPEVIMVSSAISAVVSDGHQGSVTASKTWYDLLNGNGLPPATTSTYGMVLAVDSANNTIDWSDRYKLRQGAGAYDDYFDRSQQIKCNGAGTGTDPYRSAYIYIENDSKRLAVGISKAGNVRIGEETGKTNSPTSQKSIIYSQNSGDNTTYHFNGSAIGATNANYAVSAGSAYSASRAGWADIVDGWHISVDYLGQDQNTIYFV